MPDDIELYLLLSYVVKIISTLFPVRGVQSSHSIIVDVDSVHIVRLTASKTLLDL